MTEISVANTDWSIVESLVESLRAARLGGAAVFASVAVTTSVAQAAECQLAGPQPRAVVRYVGTAERETLAAGRLCATAVEILLAARVATRGADEAARLREGLRLLNACKNAVEALPPAAASYVGDDGAWRPRLQWGSPSIDAAERPPWVVVRAPLDVAYALPAATAH